MLLLKYILPLILLVTVVVQSEGFIFGRRVCIKSNCVMGFWGSWGSCNNGLQTRTRRVIIKAHCGGSCSGSSQKARYCGPRSISFYTLENGRKLQSSDSFYTPSTASNIPSSYLNRGSIIRFVIHGWLENAMKSNINNLAYALYQAGEPVIVVDWSGYSGFGTVVPYVEACLKTQVVGDVVRNLIKTLEGRGYSLGNMHLIGFSLGGKVSSRAGSKLGGQLGRISGLDTPLYCVASGIPGLGVKGPELKTSNAQFVDTIRTTFLSGLFFQQQGHADFHVGCDGCKCKKIVADVEDQHGEAVELFSNSIRDTDCQISVAKSCKCILGFFERCENNRNNMGFKATKPSGNRMYLVANSRIPGKCKN